MTTTALPKVAFVVLVVSLLISIITGISTDRSTSVIQAGASVALTILTYCYLVETSRQTKAASEALNESVRIRKSSHIPTVVLKYCKRQDSLHGQIHEVYAVNVGRGPALRVSVFLGIDMPLNPDITSRDVSKHPRMYNCIQPIALLSGATLGPSDGSPSAGTVVLVQNPLYGMLFLDHGYGFGLVLYEDIIGNGYCTLVINEHSEQRFLYPYGDKQSDKDSVRQELARIGIPEDLSKRLALFGRADF